MSHPLNRRSDIRGLCASMLGASPAGIALAGPNPVTDEKSLVEQLRRRWLATLAAARRADETAETEYLRVDDQLPQPHPFITRNLSDRGPMKIWQEPDLRNINHWGIEPDWDERKKLRARDTALIQEWMAIRASALDASTYDALSDEAEARWEEVDSLEAEIGALASASPHSLRLKLDVWVNRHSPDPKQSSDAIVLDVLKRLEAVTA
ncbi:MAG: hypothetical protein ABIN69_05110 [Aestuariivirga sp.]